MIFIDDTKYKLCLKSMIYYPVMSLDCTYNFGLEFFPIYGSYSQLQSVNF